jgi:hypothetical protein
VVGASGSWRMLYLTGGHDGDGHCTGVCALRKLPQVEGILYTVKPVVIAIVAQALWALGRSSVKTWSLALAGVVVVALNFAGVDELVLLFSTGVTICLVHGVGNWKKTGAWHTFCSLFPAKSEIAASVAVGLIVKYGSSTDCSELFAVRVCSVQAVRSLSARPR